MKNMNKRGKARFLRGLFTVLLAVLLMSVYTVPDKAVFAAEAQAQVLPMGADSLLDEEAPDAGEGEDADKPSGEGAQAPASGADAGAAPGAALGAGAGAASGAGAGAAPGADAGAAPGADAGAASGAEAGTEAGADGLPGEEEGEQDPDALVEGDDLTGEEAKAKTPVVSFNADGLPGEEAEEQAQVLPLDADDPATPPPAGGHGWLTYWSSFAPALVGAERILFTGNAASDNGNNVVDYMYWNPYTNMLYFLVYHDSGSAGNIITSITVGPPGSISAALIAAATAGRTYQMFGVHLPGGLPDPLLFYGGTTGGPPPQNINSGNVSFTGYIVTYDPGTYGAWEPYSVPGCAAGSATPAPPSHYANSSDPGYVFSGWAPAIQPTVGGSVTYVAQWAARPTGSFSVIYNGNGGHTADGSVRYTGAGAYTAGASIQIDENSFIRPGYSFTGWNTAQDGTGDAVSPGAGTMPAGGLELYAQWIPAPYRVIYNGNRNTGGTVPSDPASHYVGEVVTVLAGTPVRAGYTFTGWLYGGRVYRAGDVLTMPAGNVTLVAQWARQAYSVTYDGNGNTGGTVPVDTATYGVGQTVTVKAGEPVKTDVNLNFNESIHFRGWFYSGKYYFSGDTFVMPAGNVTLVAVWDILINDPGPPPQPQTGNPQPGGQQTGDGAQIVPVVAVIPPADPPVAPPDEPPAQDPGPAAIPDEEVPEAEPEPAPKQIADEPEPLSDYAKWALFNLILTIVTGVVMVLLFLAYMARRREEDDEYSAGEENESDYGKRGVKGGGRTGMRLLTVAATVIAIVLFVLTEDMSLPMGMIDRWTVWHVVILAAAVVLALFGRRRYEDEETEAEFE